MLGLKLGRYFCLLLCCRVQSSLRILAPIMKGDGKTLLIHNQDAFTEAVATQRKVCACVLVRALSLYLRASMLMIRWPPGKSCDVCTAS